MSLPWRKTLHLHVGPDGLNGLSGVVARGRRTLASAQHTDLEALLATLDAQTRLRGANADLTFADTLLTLDVVAGDFADHTERQLDAIAAACSAELLGARSSSCASTWQLQHDELHLLICTVPREILDPVARALLEHGVRLRSAQPRFCRAWNEHARRFGKGAGALAVCDAQGASIACLNDGVLVAVGRSAAAGADAALEIERSVSRLQASLGLDDADACDHWLVADENTGFEPPPHWTCLPAPTPRSAGRAG